MKRMNFSQDRSTFRRFFAGTLASLCLLIALTMYGTYKFKQSEENNLWVQHTFKVLSNLQNIESLTFKIEHIEQTYVMKPDKIILQEFERYTRLLDESISKIDNLVADNSQQQQNVKILQSLVEKQTSANKYNLELMAVGKNQEALTSVTSHAFNKSIHDISFLLLEMKKLEENLLEQRLEAYSKSHTRANVVVLLGTLLSLMMVLTCILYIYKEFKKRLITQNELNRTHQVQETMLQSSPFAFIATGMDGRISLFNSAAEELLGYSQEEVIGTLPNPFHVEEEVIQMAHTLSLRFGETIAPGYDVFVYRAQRGIVESDTWTYVKKDGSRVPVKLTVTTLRDEDEKVTGFLGIAFDISKQLEFEQGIIHAKEEAQRATQAKSEFLSNMSHEIRTPMNAIMGMAEILKESNLNPEQKKYVDIFQRAGDGLLSIIDDILDLSKIESGQFGLDQSSFSLTGLISKISEILTIKAQQKNLKLKIEVEPGLHDNYLGDQNRIRQIIMNLMGNAIKFTKEGEVKLTIRGGTLNQETRELHFDIQDTGIGMTSDQIKRIFERFSQADSSISKEYGGTGLGLSISKRLVELMDGSITVSSIPGSGTTFHVSIKIRQIEHEEQPPKLPTQERKANDKVLSILLVDDNDENRLVVRSFLKNQPCTVDEAKNGKEAVEMSQNKLYDLILMDMQMPVMDGITATGIIRENEKIKNTRPTPILALTAYALKEEMHRSLEAGCNGHLTKPISKKSLLLAIQNYTAELIVEIDSELTDLIPDYLKNRHAELEALKEALSKKDFTTIGATGHKLRGSAGSYGFDDLSLVGKELEDKAKVQDEASIVSALSQYDLYLKMVRVTYKT